jgi:predicted polyphosphate/ATP-dependent NAD kinase
MRGDRRWRIGLIVNPIAGMGGSVGLKGTDGPEILEEARRRGAEPVAHLRTVRALHKLLPLRHRLELVAAAGAMGEDAARRLGLLPAVVGAGDAATTAEDTVRAARAMAERRCALILFAGGDGTARDVHDGAGAGTPLLGIPTGVKMHSAVFAVSPEAAGMLTALFVEDRGKRIGLRNCEIMDIDEAQVRQGRPAARLHGYASVPYERNLLQGAKIAALPEDDPAIDAAASEIAQAMQPGMAYVVGPGRTAKRVLAALGLKGTLLGVDLVIDRKLVGKDLAEADLMRLSAGLEISIIVGVTGGQGFIFGRGSQPIGASAIRRAGRDRLIVLAGARKLACLEARRLLLDTGDPALDQALQGHMRIVTGPGEVAIMRVSAAACIQ